MQKHPAGGGFRMKPIKIKLQVTPEQLKELKLLANITAQKSIADYVCLCVTAYSEHLVKIMQKNLQENPPVEGVSNDPT
jgi:hypothetical protein